MFRHKSTPKANVRETRVSRIKGSETRHAGDVRPAKRTELEQQQRKAIEALPELLREIAEATDYETAMQLALAKGGQRMQIARRPGEDSALSKVVGIEKARIIGKALNPLHTGMEYLIPKGPFVIAHRKAEIGRLSALGVSRMKIAEQLGIHVRTVQIYRRQLRDEGAVFPPYVPRRRVKGNPDE